MNKVVNYFKNFCKDVDLNLNEFYSIDSYYVFHSENLWEISTEKLSKRFRFDENGALLTFYEEIGYKYNPAYIAYYGLMSFNKFLITNNVNYLENFKNALFWIRNNGVSFRVREVEAQKWIYDFEWKNGSSILKKGWVSAMAQGLIASLLIRGYFFYNDEIYLNLARKSINLFKIDIEDGGVRAKYNNYVYYEEYPSYPLSMVLDGILFALIGVYELKQIDDSYDNIFIKGIRFVEDNFDNIWNFNNVWTKYGIFDGKQFFSTLSYHKLNLCLINFFKQKGFFKNIFIKNKKNCYIIAFINLMRLIKENL